MAQAKSNSRSNRSTQSHEQAPIKRIYRSQKDKMIAGVCGGIAEYFNVDPVWTRLIAVLLVFLHGMGIILYIVAWILIPKNPNQAPGKDTAAEQAAEKVIRKAEAHAAKHSSSNRERHHHSHKPGRARLVIGIILVLIGLGFLLQQLFPGFQFAYVWALILIAIGIVLLIGSKDHDHQARDEDSQEGTTSSSSSGPKRA